MRAPALLLVSVFVLGCRPRSAAPSAAPAPACPIVPLALVMTPPGQPARPILSLAAGGKVTISWLGPATTATLDPRGCLVGKDGLWAELAPQDQLWTPHETFAVSGNCLPLSGGAALCVTPDGKVQRRDAKGTVEINAAGGLELVGYREEARCAGLLLVAAFTSMLPSMAVSDGHPARAPTPAGSRCTGFARP